jgi:hypothetical protein
MLPSDLIRAARTGNVAASRQLVTLANTGAISTRELAEVKKLASSRELADNFRGLDSAPSPSMGESSANPVFDVAALAPDLSAFTNAAELPSRFQKDLALVRELLLNAPGLSREQKAERLMAFFENYATRFFELSGKAASAQTIQTGSAESAAGEAPSTVSRFRDVLTATGFAEIQFDGRNGVELAAALLQNEINFDALRQRLDAPNWNDNPSAPLNRPQEKASREAAGVSLRGVKATGEALVNIVPVMSGRNNVPVAKKTQEPARRAQNKKLGRNMLWNFLHLYRADDGPMSESAKREHALKALVVLALVLAFLGVIVMLLTA